MSPVPRRGPSNASKTRIQTLFGESTKETIGLSSTDEVKMMNEDASEEAKPQNKFQYEETSMAGEEMLGNMKKSAAQLEDGSKNRGVYQLGC